MNELITELTKVEEQLTMKLAYADDKINALTWSNQSV